MHVLDVCDKKVKANVVCLVTAGKEVPSASPDCNFVPAGTKLVLGLSKPRELVPSRTTVLTNAIFTCLQPFSYSSLLHDFIKPKLSSASCSVSTFSDPC